VVGDHITFEMTTLDENTESDSSGEEDADEDVDGALETAAQGVKERAAGAAAAGTAAAGAGTGTGGEPGAVVPEGGVDAMPSQGDPSELMPIAVMPTALLMWCVGWMRFVLCQGKERGARKLITRVRQSSCFLLKVPFLCVRLCFCVLSLISDAPDGPDMYEGRTVCGFPLIPARPQPCREGCMSCSYVVTVIAAAALVMFASAVVRCQFGFSAGRSSDSVLAAIRQAAGARAAETCCSGGLHRRPQCSGTRSCWQQLFSTKWVSVCVHVCVHVCVCVCVCVGWLEQVASFEAVPEDNASDLSELSEVRC
jgi:hypothetical protein